MRRGACSLHAGLREVLLVLLLLSRLLSLLLSLLLMLLLVLLLANNVRFTVNCVQGCGELMAYLLRTPLLLLVLVPSERCYFTQLQACKLLMMSVKILPRYRFCV